MVIVLTTQQCMHMMELNNNNLLTYWHSRRKSFNINELETLVDEL
jgi:hypothetical protein